MTVVRDGVSDDVVIMVKVCKQGIGGGEINKLVTTYDGGQQCKVLSRREGRNVSVRRR